MLDGDPPHTVPLHRSTTSVGGSTPALNGRRSTRIAGGRGRFASWRAAKPGAPSSAAGEGTERVERTVVSIGLSSDSSRSPLALRRR
jgi:hypothetical protein